MELLDKETKLINVQHSLKEAEDAIEKLKQVVVDQKKGLEQAKERDIAMNERLHELEETARVVSQMNIQISLEKMKAALRDIEDELRGLEVKQARQEVALYKMFLPEEQLKKDQEVVQLQLMMERVSIKCDLVLNYLQKQYQLESLDNLLELDPFAQLLIKASDLNFCKALLITCCSSIPCYTDSVTTRSISWPLFACVTKSCIWNSAD